MKFTLTFMMGLLLIASCEKISAATDEADDSAVAANIAALDDVEANFTGDEEHIRNKRATCDLLSGLGWNHSACAARCILMNRGFRGGYCNDKAVCVCRK